MARKENCRDRMQRSLTYFAPKRNNTKVPMEYTQKLTQKQWEQLFLSLYKNTKQKEAFDFQYKFLNFAQPFLTRLREIGQNYGSIECVRCIRADETHKHWLFSCASSQNIFILPSLFIGMY